MHGLWGVPRFTGKTRNTGKTTEIPERPKNDRELIYAKFMRSNVLNCFRRNLFCKFIANIIVCF